MGTVNLKTLAEHLGLTQSTISRALNNYPDISQKTRDRVHKVAQELGYKPNTNARRLATGLSETIGIMVSENIDQPGTPFFAELMCGIGEVLIKRNWDLSIIYFREDMKTKDFVHQLIQSGRTSGLILTRILSNDDRIEVLRDTGFPFVVHGRSRDTSNYSWFDIDNELAFEELVDYLVSLGHRKIAHIGGKSEFNHSRLRRSGYRNGLDKHRLEYVSDWDITTNMTDKCGYDAMKAILSLAERPTAITCISDIVAFGAIKAIADEGLEVGRDISVVGYDGIDLGAYICPGLTTMAQPLKDSGVILAEMLMDIIDKKVDGPVQHFEKAKLIIRDSACPPRS